MHFYLQVEVVLFGKSRKVAVVPIGSGNTRFHAGVEMAKDVAENKAVRCLLHGQISGNPYIDDGSVRFSVGILIRKCSLGSAQNKGLMNIIPLDKRVLRFSSRKIRGFQFQPIRLSYL